ncbi:hypothetical protein [Thermus sediminis]|uniref:hypothetical protein n=1 Tax=Thermus sediminis TaxID=1761908 RepID=UPI00130024E5|nr:hypothetical protein [Thermus sediminis]
MAGRLLPLGGGGDTGRWDPVLLASRARAWTGLYEGQAWWSFPPTGLLCSCPT